MLPQAIHGLKDSILGRVHIARGDCNPTVKKNVSPRLVLFALLALDIRLPSLTRLQLLIDSDGKTFKTREAFEKFVERSKKTFKAICSRTTQQGNNMEGTHA